MICYFLFVSEDPMARFRKFLNERGVDIDEDILNNIAESTHLSTKTIACMNSDVALTIYQDAAYFPMTTTRAQVRSTSNIAIDGDLFIGNASKCLFFRAFQSHQEMKVLKVLVKPQESIDKEVALFISLKGFADGIALVPVEKLEAHINYDNKRSAAKKFEGGILMPYYAYTLHDLPESIPFTRAEYIISRIRNAIDFIHGNCWLHGDVKSSNIFFTAEGSVFLGDYGCSRNYADIEDFHAGTIMFQCCDVPANKFPKLFDLIGLAISIAVKCQSQRYKRSTMWCYDELKTFITDRCPAEFNTILLDLIAK
jgi:serine/threonine protein kinase